MGYNFPNIKIQMVDLKYIKKKYINLISFWDTCFYSGVVDP